MVLQVSPVLLHQGLRIHGRAHCVQLLRRPVSPASICKRRGDCLVLVQQKPRDPQGVRAEDEVPFCIFELMHNSAAKSGASFVDETVEDRQDVLERQVGLTLGLCERNLQVRESRRGAIGAMDSAWGRFGVPSILGHLRAILGQSFNVLLLRCRFGTAGLFSEGHFQIVSKNERLSFCFSSHADR